MCVYVCGGVVVLNEVEVIAISDQWQVVSGPERLAAGGTKRALFYTFYVHIADHVQNACMQNNS